MEVSHGSAMKLAQHSHQSSPAPPSPTADVYEPGGAARHRSSRYTSLASTKQQIRPWFRFFEFPVEIDNDKVRAKLEYRSSEIYVPKALTSQPKVIRIKESGEEDQAGSSRWSRTDVSFVPRSR
jgi:hypothetical protein